MAKTKLGLALTGAPYSVQQITKYAKIAERNEFDSVWFAEDYFLRDAITSLAAVATATSSVRLGPGVINPYTRNPVLIAETMATLDELSEGRAFLGLGSGVQPLLKSMGIDYRRPITSVREATLIIRALLQGRRVDFDGTAFKVSGAELGVNPYFELMGRFRPIRSAIPIYVAARGPKMLQMAGEVGDGVLLTASCSPNYVRTVRPYLERGAQIAGRSLRSFQIAVYILASLSPSPRAVRGAIAAELADCNDHLLRAYGVEPSTVYPIRKKFQDEGIAAAAELITQELVDTFSACGQPGKIVNTVNEYVRAGVTLPIIMPVETNLPRLIASLS